jgi:hypothetical protein
MVTYDIGTCNSEGKKIMECLIDTWLVLDEIEDISLLISNR